MQLNAARAAVSTLAPRSGERVARAQRGPGEGPRLAVLLPLTRLAPSALATLSPLRGARVHRVRGASQQMFSQGETSSQTQSAATAAA